MDKREGKEEGLKRRGEGAPQPGRASRNSFVGEGFQEKVFGRGFFGRGFFRREKSFTFCQVTSVPA